MTFLDKIKAVILISKSRAHLINVIQQLENQSYDKLITDTVKSSETNHSINVIVKGYFWASRTIKDCDCLPRSIAIYQQLRAIGYTVEHKFGVNKQDQTMAAHAWVEYQNKPLNESKDLKLRFKIMNHPD